MSLVSGILPATNVVVGLDVASKKRAFERIGELLEAGSHLAHNTVFESLFAREKLGSTGLGEGIAIPHGRIKGLHEAVGALIKLKTPIPFDAPDGRPVSLLFVLLVPEQATDMHLQILGELAQMFSDKPMRTRLGACDDASELFRLVQEWSPHDPG
jgi:PTS system nitrogen regulatory IIA component